VTRLPEGRAIVYCQGAFGTPNGKTAHGLVRRTRRYEVLSVVDAVHAGKDAGAVLEGKPRGMPVFATVEEAIAGAEAAGTPATHLVVGLAPDGGRLSGPARSEVLGAVDRGLNVDCGLHDFLTEIPEFVSLAAERGVTLRDIRKPPPRNELHFFTGKIEEVTAPRIAILGTDSAIGKRTTAWVLTDALNERGVPTEMVGTGQTAWMQGVRFGIILDSLVNDFLSGEIEHAVWSAWKETDARALVLEGQGSLMNPAYPGGYELLAAGRPAAVVLQHAPARLEYDGFPGYALHPIETQIEAIQVVSGKPVAAITVNHEGLAPGEIPAACRKLRETTGLPAVDVLTEGAESLVDAVLPYLEPARRESK